MIQHVGAVPGPNRPGDDLTSFAADLAQVTSGLQAFELLSGFANRLGFGHLSLAIESSGRSDNEPDPHWTTLDAETLERFRAVGFDGHDPVRRFARRSRDPFVWSHDGWPGDHSAEARNLMMNLRLTSIEAGMTIPVWGRGGQLTIADAFGCRRQILAMQPLIADLMFLATAQTARVIDRLMADRTRSVLTRREMEILELTARGLNARSIARLLKIVEPTVKFHLRSIRSKLNVRNKTEAVARYTALGFSFHNNFDQDSVRSKLRSAAAP